MNKKYLLRINLKTILALLVIILFPAAVSFALPLPPNTKIIREEVVETGDDNKDVVFCESTLGEEKIVSFYRNEMEKKGYSIFMQQKNMMIYTKGEDLFMVMLAPVPEGGKTSLILTTSKIKMGSMGQAQGCEDLPDVPVYPGAQCMGSMKMRNMRAISSRYTVGVELEEVLNFYRVKMVQYGWTIESEKRMGDNMPGDSLSSTMGGMGVDLSNVTLLVFKKAAGERSTVNLMPNPSGKGTMINITYEEKK